jgi:hypothetical protein
LNEEDNDDMTPVEGEETNDEINKEVEETILQHLLNWNEKRKSLLIKKNESSQEKECILLS